MYSVCMYIHATLLGFCFHTLAAWLEGSSVGRQRYIYILLCMYLFAYALSNRHLGT
ncbi:hypothetical protein F4810DRAFT_681225 [Camillea tinctor]|nr:hypothetical protein F4810DRAFT_681225 [Camillea tinctor]